MTNKQIITKFSKYLLGVIGLLGCFIFIHLNVAYELDNPDIWLHIKTGEYALEHKAVPQVDPFSHTLMQTPWINHSWLPQVFYYFVFKNIGTNGLLLFSSILVSIAFLVLFLTIYQKRKDMLTLATLLSAIAIVSQVRLNIRPENFSILFFALYLYIIKKYLKGNKIFLLTIVQFFWVNCHGFFILGPMLLAIFLIGEKLKITRVLPWEWNTIEPLDKKSYRNLIKVFFLVLLISFLNPYGYKGTFYPLQIISLFTQTSQLAYSYVNELIPLIQLDSLAAFKFYCLVILTSIIFLLDFRKINISYLIGWLFFLGISWQINRNILFFNFFSFIVIGDILIKNITSPNSLLAKNIKNLGIFKYLPIIILFLFISKQNSSILKNYQTKNRLPDTICKHFPEKPANFILEKNLPDNIFNLFNDGAYLIYRLYPTKKVFIDGRTELYGDGFFKNYCRLLTPDTKILQDSFQKYNINTVILDNADAELASLFNYFFNSKEWALIHFYNRWVIFIKNTPQNKPLIDTLKIDISTYETPKLSISHLDSSKDALYELHINHAQTLYYFGAYNQAKKEIMLALSILPKSSPAYVLLGSMYTEEKLYKKALKNLYLGFTYDPYNYQTLIALGNFYIKTNKLEKAEKIFKRLIKLHPYLTEGHYLLANVSININKEKLAIRHLETAFKLKPLNTKYFNSLYELLLKNNDFNEAIKSCKQALKVGIITSDEFTERIKKIYSK